MVKESVLEKIYWNERELGQMPHKTVKQNATTYILNNLLWHIHSMIDKRCGIPSHAENEFNDACKLTRIYTVQQNRICFSMTCL